MAHSPLVNLKAELIWWILSVFFSFVSKYLAPSVSSFVHIHTYTYTFHMRQIMKAAKNGHKYPLRVELRMPMTKNEGEGVLAI